MKPKTPVALAVEEDVALLRGELLKLIRLAGVSQRGVDQRNGWNLGYTSQVLKGSLKLTLRHVVGILWTLEIPLERFFQHVAQRNRG